MLDDVNVLKQRDRSQALAVAAELYRQVLFAVELQNSAHDGREITSVVVAGMGGSALAADMAKVLLAEELTVPLEVVKGYQLPAYVGEHTLVIASSHSGNTEETLACFKEALARGAQVAATAAAGWLEELATERSVVYAPIPHDTQPRMAVFYNLKALLALLKHFGLIDSRLIDEMESHAEWLKTESDAWVKETTVDHNYAKQLALLAVGKTPVFYSGNLMAPIAYKWKISWNENAKNLAFWNYLPEFNHNEFMGWTSHPIEKPFVIFDLLSNLEPPCILQRFALTDRLLSGRRPKANAITVRGDTLLAQMLWGCILADFVSIYVAILNNVNPTQVDLIEKFKQELTNSADK